MKTLFKILPFVFIFITACTKDDYSNDPVIEYNSLADIDGNLYNTIILGKQTWMLENLKTTKYNDGSPITEYNFANFGNNWASLNDEIGHYQWANTDDLNNINTNPLPFDYYGAMYNYFALESGKLAPEGWRLPTKEDFIELQRYLSAKGFLDLEAVALKSEKGWHTLSGNGFDAIHFNGLPNGYVSAQGTATGSEIICTWATAETSADTNLVTKTRLLVQLHNENTINYVNSPIQIGAGVRCIKITEEIQKD